MTNFWPIALTVLMKLIEELFMPGHFILLTAPVAAGKTRLIMDTYQESDKKLIFVSPLRALANEVWAKLESQHKNIYLAGGNEALDVVMVNFLQAKKAVLVVTMELLHEEFLDECSLQRDEIVVVLDEFHLFYHWGESFRPLLHDRFLAILNADLPVLGLSATMSETMVEALVKDLRYHLPYWIFLNFGNHELYRAPQSYHLFTQVERALFFRIFWHLLKEKPKNDVYLFFCSFRSEVDDLTHRAQRLGYRALGCVGGEVETFLEQLRAMEGKVDILFATTTLSHGVNLPEIKKVFIGYEVKNYDFWLQMVGRGGRAGAVYEVYTFDKFHFNSKDFFKNKMGHYLTDWMGF